MRKWLAAAAALLALIATTGCRPSAPDQSDWQSSAEQAVSDMVSEVATSRLTVSESLRDRFVGYYPVVVLTYSEEAAGTASDSVSTLQPPRLAQPSYDALTGLLSDATDAIARARLAVTDQDARESRQALSDLGSVLRRLRRLDDRLMAVT